MRFKKYFRPTVMLIFLSNFFAISAKWQDVNEQFAEAVNSGDMQSVQYLLSEGASVNGALGCIPLHIAIVHENLAMVKCLVESGADINIDNGKLACVAAFRDTDILLYLFSRGLNVYAVDEFGRSTLMCAARTNLDNVKFLIKCGVNIHAYDNEGRTALSHAVGAVNFATVKYLVEQQADVEDIKRSIFGDLREAFEWVCNWRKKEDRLEGLRIVEYLYGKITPVC